MVMRDLEMRLQRIKNKKRAADVRRFIQNLFILFDGRPPVHIKQSINDILTLLE